MDFNNNYLQIPGTAYRRGSDPGPSSGYYDIGSGTGTNTGTGTGAGAGAGAGTGINMGPTSLAGGSSFLPGNTQFSYPQPDPLGDVSSLLYAAPPVSFQTDSSSSGLDSLKDGLKLFEAQLQDIPGLYETNGLRQLQAVISRISWKINNALNLRANNPGFETSVPVQHHQHHQHRQPSTKTKSSLSECFLCRICQNENKKRTVLSSRSTFSRHIADFHGGKTRHRCHVPGCPVVRSRSDKIKKHRKKHAAERPEFNSLLTSEHLETKMPPPERCTICYWPVDTWDEWMIHIVDHCRLEGTTSSGDTGRFDDDGDNDSDGDDSGNGGSGGGGSGYGYDGQGHSQQNDVTCMGSHFGVEDTSTFSTGGYNGYTRKCSQTAPCSPKAVPSDNEAPEVANSECDTLADSSENTNSMTEKGDLVPGEFSSTKPSNGETKPTAQHVTFASPSPTKRNIQQGYLCNDALRQPPIPRKKLTQAVLNFCLPPSNDSTPAYKPQGKGIPSSNSSALVRKNCHSRKPSIPMGDSRSPRLISLEHAVPRAEHKRRTLRPSRGLSKWQTGHSYYVF